MYKCKRQILLIILATFSIGILLEWLGYIKLPSDTPAETYASVYSGDNPTAIVSSATIGTVTLSATTTI